MRIEVRSDEGPVADAEVVVNGVTVRTPATGVVSVPVTAGRVDITVVKEPFAPLSSSVTVAEGRTQSLVFELEERPEFEEQVIVTATRTETRLEDQPLRVEVVPGDEVQEKIMMTPGDVSMLLAETNGLRVQTTSPSLGGATVRIQGLRGRYTQILADGLPLYGGQTGTVGLLQIPPMDLGQVEVIKGVASALYGMSAVGGVVNLVSRRPPRQGRERELLVNGTTHGGADLVNWLAGPLGGRWGYTFTGGVHAQQGSDLDKDGWTDLPMYRRVVARPRVFWDNGAGRSLLLALGGMGEQRRGGTTRGRSAPDGRPFAENLDTRRFDGGAVYRMTTGGGRVLAARGSATAQTHTHTFGPVVEDDAHQTIFGELSLTGTTNRHTWVTGGAVQSERFRSSDVPRFDYLHVVPGVFGQDEFRIARRLTVSGSARLDVHNVFGAFLSPRVSLLVRPDEAWTVRLSTGRGYVAPTPFTEDTDATGLTPVAPLDGVRAERADSVSADVTWARAPLDVTATVFYSRIRDALAAEAGGGAAFPIRIVNVDGPTVTRGTELIAHYRRGGSVDLILSHMFLWSTEPAFGGGGRREVPLNPRHAASVDLLKQIGPARIGLEAFYTGSQALEDNPFRPRGFGHVLYGGLVDWAVGRSRVYVNVENLGDVRQTREHPLVRPSRAADGRWTVDAWAPLEGRTVNAGVRWRF
ncbi:MAG: TonB-dependent receptor [Acidobacteria bacterium]|nr:TonB-dependent receptor [Acidobacteriota bacterium]